MDPNQQRPRPSELPAQPQPIGSTDPRNPRDPRTQPGQSVGSPSGSTQVAQSTQPTTTDLGKKKGKGPVIVGIILLTVVVVIAVAIGLLLLLI